MLFDPLIEIQNQILGEAVGITGTPFSLHYRSDRVPGRKAAYTLKIPVTGTSIPAGLKSSELEVQIAGQRFTKTFPPDPRQCYTFTWDGKDADGRVVQGKQLAKIRIGYTYRASYPRPELTKWQERSKTIGTWDARTLGVGGWSLSVHHAHDGVGQVLYLGDGRRRSKLQLNHASSLTERFIPSENGSEIYMFDSTGRHLRTHHGLTGGMLYRFEHDADGRLTAIEDGDGNVTRIEHNSGGAPTAIIAPYGQRTILSTNADGYLVTITNPAGESGQFSYSNDGLLTTAIDPNGNPYRFTYDDQGRLQRSADPAGGFSFLASTRDEKGSLVALMSALGRESTYLTERLPTGEERQVNKCCGSSATVVLTKNGTDGSHRVNYPDGTISSLVEEPDPRWGPLAPLLKSFSLNTPGGVAFTVSLDRKVDLADPANLLSVKALTDTLTINGRKYTRAFDMVKKLITSRTPAGRQTVTTVDDRGRVVKAEVPGPLSVNFAYDKKGRLITITQAEGDEARVVSISYDAEGRIASITDPLKRTVRFEYDRAGQITKQILPDGREIAYAYDSNGNPKSITPPGRPAHSFEYTPVDLTKDYLPPIAGADSKDTSYAYNKDKQLTKISRPDGKITEMAYDNVGHLETVTLPGGMLRLAFDAKTEQLKTVTAPDAGTLSFAYDGFLPTKTTWERTINGIVSWTYDNNLRLTSQSVNGGQPVAFKHDPDGLLTQAGALALERDPQNGLLTGTKLGKLATAHEYNGFGERKRFSAAFNNKEMFALHYERDALGRIIKLTETIDGQRNAYTYDYDLAGRLTDVTKDDAKIAHYDYDSNGNRLAYKGQHGEFSGSYDAQDRPLKYGDTNYTHTANGEWFCKTVNGKTTRYDYDVFGNLKAVSLPGGLKIEYLIDGTNCRIGKKVDGTLAQGFLYQDQSKPVAELDGQNNVVSRFIYATRLNVPDYMEKGGKTYRIITDHLGSPRIVIDVATGEIAQRMDYDAFGNVLQDTNSGFQPFGFAGGLYDPDTKLTRFGARDYDAPTGRWTVKDPIGFLGGDINLYAYVINDPITLADPLGLWPAFVAQAARQRQVEALINPPSNSAPETGFLAGTRWPSRFSRAERVFTQGWEGDVYYSPPWRRDPYWPPTDGGPTPHYFPCFLKPGPLFRGDRDVQDVPPGWYGNPVSGDIDPRTPSNPTAAPPSIGVSVGVRF